LEDGDDVDQPTTCRCDRRVSRGGSCAKTSSGPRPESFTEVVHGESVNDEYRWMESPARAAAGTDWLRTESSRTRAALDALPERAGFLSALKALNLVRVSDVTVAGERRIFRRISKRDHVAKLIVRDPDRRERTLVDPNTCNGSVLAINNTSVS